MTNPLPPVDFDPKEYLRLNPDVAAAGVDPILHYVQTGCNEGRLYRRAPPKVPAAFDPKIYLELNPDVKAAGIDPVSHYVNTGEREGRSYRPKQVYAQWQGHCPICDAPTEFIAYEPWLRDHLYCRNCKTSSIPRDRAMMNAITSVIPNWRDVSIHESSPSPYGLSSALAKAAKNYTVSQLFPEEELGSVINGVRCENLERQTFKDNSFDLVVTMDVMEHVFHPDLVHREIWRTLKPGGYHLHTTPVYRDIAKTRIVATLGNDGTIKHLEPPEYHGNPVDESGALVTVRYGQDITDLIPQWAPFDVELRRYNNKTQGIVGEFTDVFVCRKQG